MIYNYIWVSSIICFILSIVFINIIGKYSGFIFIIGLMHLFAFLIMICIAYLLKLINMKSDILKYLISFVLSFSSIILFFNHVNGANIFNDIMEPYFLIDFMILLFPYILSNIVCFIFLIFEGRRQRKQPLLIDEGN